MNKVNIGQVVGMFEAVKSNTFVGITYEAPVAMLKTGNPYVKADAKVVKVSTISGQFGADYGTKVEKVTGEAFEVGERAWGDNTGKGVIYKDNKPHSVQLTLDNSPSSVKYFVNGVETPKDVLRPYLPKKKAGEPVTVRDYRFDRIKSLRMGGKEFIME